MLRSMSLLRHDALLIRSAARVGPGSAKQRCRTMLASPGCIASGTRELLLPARVQRQIQRQNVNAGLAQKARPTGPRCCPPPAGEPGLPACCAPWRPAAPGIAPPPAKCRDRGRWPSVVTRSTGIGMRGIFRLQFLDVLLDPVVQRLAGRPEVGAAGIGRIVGRRHGLGRHRSDPASVVAEGRPWK